MTSVEIGNLGGPLGAEVNGLDPARPLQEEDSRLLRRAFDDRGVLVFRGLDIDYEYQARMSEMLIGIEANRDARGASDVVEESYISNEKEGAAAPFGRLQFHSDTMWANDPLQVLSLYGLHVGSPVAPTTFASATYAWETLPEALRSRIGGLSAVHTAGQRLSDSTEDDDLVVSIPERRKSTKKPIALLHPSTGRTMLYEVIAKEERAFSCAPAASRQ